MDGELFLGALALLYLVSAVIAADRFRGTLAAVLCLAGFLLGFLAWANVYAHETHGPLAAIFRAILPRGRRGMEVFTFTGLVVGHALVLAGLAVSPSGADRRQLNAHLRNHPPIACPNCGSEHPLNATRCLTCKAKLPPASEPH